MKNFKLYGSGFTLVELLVVIALISILSVASVAIINPATRIKSARDASRKSSMAQIVIGLSSFYALRVSYPAVLTDLVPNELKAVPLSPLGESFGYRALNESDGLCATEARDCQKVVIYDVYELPKVACNSGVTAYLGWTNAMVGLGKICSANLPSPNDLPTAD